jgi:hypothetical protein
MCRLLGGRKKGARKNKRTAGKGNISVVMGTRVYVCVCRLLGRDVCVETKGWREVAGKVYIRGYGCVSGRRIVAAGACSPVNYSALEYGEVIKKLITG